MAKSKVMKETGSEGEVSTSELAAIIGKTPQWVRQLTRDRILSQVARGKYSLADAVQAYILHVCSRIRGTGSVGIWDKR